MGYYAYLAMDPKNIDANASKEDPFDQKCVGQAGWNSEIEKPDSNGIFDANIDLVKTFNKNSDFEKHRIRYAKRSDRPPTHHSLYPFTFNMLDGKYLTSEASINLL